MNLPRSLKKAAEDRARQDDVSLNPFIARALAEEMNAGNAAIFLEKRGQGDDLERAARWLKTRSGCGCTASDLQ